MLVPGPGRGGHAQALAARRPKARTRWVSRKESQAYEAAGVEYAGKIRTDPAAVGREVVDENPLFAQFDAYREGPGIWKPRQYFKVYHRHLGRFIGRAVNVVEIGVYSGGSLRMWRDYFGTKVTIHGVDIDESVAGSKPTASRSRSVTSRIVASGGSSSIAFRRSTSSSTTAATSRSIRSPRSRRCCRTSRTAASTSARTSAAWTTRFTPTSPDSRGISPPWTPGGQSENQPTTGLQQSIEGIHLYPYIAVIEKPEKPFGRFSTEVRGTEWIDDRTAHLLNATPEAPAGGVDAAAGG